MNCPFCGKNNIALIPPPEGSTNFILASVNLNTNPPSVNPSGMPVDISGCASCGSIFLHSERLINHQIVHK